MDYHAVLPPEYRAEATLRVETFVSASHHNVDWTIRASGSGWSIMLWATQLLLKIQQTPAKVHLRSNIDGEYYIRKFDDLAKTFAPHSEQEHEFYNPVLDSIRARYGKYILTISKFFRSTLRSGANSQATAYVRHLC